MVRLCEYYDDGDIFDKAHEMAYLMKIGVHPSHAFAMVASSAGEFSYD